MITAVVPAFNEETRIAKTVAAVLNYVDEVLVIDDGSQDNTAWKAVHAGARILQQAKNKGYISAVKWGFQEASGDIVVTIDADGEFPPARIPALTQPILDGQADMVQGSRNRVPRPSERFLTFLANLKAPVGDTGTGFRALTVGLARKLDLLGICICGVFSLEVHAKGGRILEIPIELQQVDKPRRIAWYHFRQFFYVLPWLFQDSGKANQNREQPRSQQPWVG